MTLAFRLLRLLGCSSLSSKLARPLALVGQRLLRLYDTVWYKHRQVNFVEKDDIDLVELFGSPLYELHQVLNVLDIVVLVTPIEQEPFECLHRVVKLHPGHIKHQYSFFDRA